MIGLGLMRFFLIYRSKKRGASQRALVSGLGTGVAIAGEWWLRDLVARNARGRSPR